jgi:hypothetical protein
MCRRHKVPHVYLEAAQWDGATVQGNAEAQLNFCLLCLLEAFACRKVVVMLWRLLVQQVSSLIQPSITGLF